MNCAGSFQFYSRSSTPPCKWWKNKGKFNNMPRHRQIMLDFDLSILGGGWAGLLIARKALNLGVNNVSLIEEG